MVYISEHVNLQADLCGIPPQTAAIYKRRLLENSYLSQSGRGRSAAQATAKDAAVTLIALVASPRPSTASEYVKNFGDMICETMTCSDPEQAEWLALSKHHTFLDGITRILEALGSEEFASLIAKKVKRELVQELGRDDYDREEYSTLAVCYSKITIEDRIVRGIAGIGTYSAEYRLGMKHSWSMDPFWNGLESKRTVHRNYLQAIASQISGKGNFETLVRSAFLEI